MILSNEDRIEAKALRNGVLLLAISAIIVVIGFGYLIGALV